MIVNVLNVSSLNKNITHFLKLCPNKSQQSLTDPKKTPTTTNGPVLGTVESKIITKNRKVAKISSRKKNIMIRGIVTSKIRSNISRISKISSEK